MRFQRFQRLLARAGFRGGFSVPFRDDFLVAVSASVSVAVSDSSCNYWFQGLGLAGLAGLAILAQVDRADRVNLGSV